MKTIILSALCGGLFCASLSAADEFDSALDKAAGGYVERLRVAAEELAATRVRIVEEKAPFLADMRAAEHRIIAAETEIMRLETGAETAGTDKRKLLQDLEAQRKTAAYIATLSRDALRALGAGLAAGEEQFSGERVQALERALGENENGPNLDVAIDVAEFMLARAEQRLGGHVVEGSALLAENNQLAKGTLAFAGPETFFLPEGNGLPGVLRAREGSRYPTSHALPNWRADDAAAFFAGGTGAMIADASGGKALRLEQTRGTWLEHVSKGGVVAYFIVAVGFVALLLILGKLRDVARMKVDSREKVREFLAMLSVRSWAQAEAALGTLRATTRELFAEGLRHRSEPKAILEERLNAVLLDQRLHFERRLPLLAVIATAAPLMGLLGTVVGMVKTFALITVFGTGNAGKLSSGISEVLVATELGLAVAIPALVVHGFLAHRIHKNLALLERHALEFVTAAEVVKLRAASSDETPALVG